MRAACEPGLAGTKNQDIYGALKTGGVLAGALGNNKSSYSLSNPANAIDRAFGVFGQNMTGASRIMKFAIAVQPSIDVPSPLNPTKYYASFNQRRDDATAPETEVFAGAFAGATAVRTVFVPATPYPLKPRYPIRVDVSEIEAKALSIVSANGEATATLQGHGFGALDTVVIVGANQDEYNGLKLVTSTSGDTFTFAVPPTTVSPATGSILTALYRRNLAQTSSMRLARKVWLNFDPTAPQTLVQPDPVDPQAPVPDINTTEFYDVSIGQSVVQDISFPSVKSPGWETPGWETPGWETPGWETPGWETPGWETPGWETPGWETPGWETPGWETSSIDDTTAQQSSVRDVRFPVKNKSNSPVAVNLRAMVNGSIPSNIKLQGVAYRLYTTPGQSCGEFGSDGKLKPALTGHAQVIFNIPNLDVSPTNFVAPLDSSSPQNGTVVLLPGETIYWNVRAWDTLHRGPGANTFDPASVVVAAIRQPLGTIELENPDITNPPVEMSLAVVTSTLPPALMGAFYSEPVEAVGGTPFYNVDNTPSYNWTITGGSLPAGMSLDGPTGFIQGTPSGPAGVSTFTVTASDSEVPPKTASRSLSISVTEGFTPAASMNTGRIFHTQTRLPDGNVLIAGGRGGAGAILSSAEIYNPQTDTFTVVPGGLGTARQEHTATMLHDGRVLIAGGLGPDNVRLNSAEIYDPVTGTFSATGALFTGRSQHTATLLDSGAVLIAGGLSSSGAITASAELYSPDAGVFGSTNSLTTARYSHTATALPNGLVLIAGGFGSGLTSIANNELYFPPVPETEFFGGFGSGGTMVTARHAHQAVLLANGKVLLVGGVAKPTTDAGTTTAFAELYDPAENSSAPAGTMNSPRQQFVATLLRDGRVLIAGGQNVALPAAEDELTSAETYNPEGGGSFTVTTDLSSARARPAATLLANGTVLVTGGDSNTASSLATTELFHPNPSGGILDQQQPVVGTDTMLATHIIYSSQSIAQTVTAGISGFVTQVDLPAGCAGGDSLTIGIQLANSGAPGGSTLASETVAGGFPLPAEDGLFNTFVFDRPVYLAAGTRYGIVLTSLNESGNCGVKLGPVGNSYTAGQGYFRPGGDETNWQPLTAEDRQDLPFRVFVR